MPRKTTTSPPISAKRAADLTAKALPPVRQDTQQLLANRLVQEQRNGGQQPSQGGMRRGQYDENVGSPTGNPGTVGSYGARQAQPVGQRVVSQQQRYASSRTGMADETTYHPSVQPYGADGRRNPATQAYNRNNAFTDPGNPGYGKPVPGAPVPPPAAGTQPRPPSTPPSTPPKPSWPTSEAQQHMPQSNTSTPSSPAPNKPSLPATSPVNDHGPTPPGAKPPRKPARPTATPSGNNYNWSPQNPNVLGWTSPNGTTWTWSDGSNGANEGWTPQPQPRSRKAAQVETATNDMQKFAEGSNAWRRAKARLEAAQGDE